MAGTWLSTPFVAPPSFCHPAKPQLISTWNQQPPRVYFHLHIQSGFEVSSLSVNSPLTGENTLRGSHVSAPSRLPRKYMLGQSRQESFASSTKKRRILGVLPVPTFAARKKAKPLEKDRSVVVGRTRGDRSPGVENDYSLHDLLPRSGKSGIGRISHLSQVPHVSHVRITRDEVGWQDRVPRPCVRSTTRMVALGEEWRRVVGRIDRLTLVSACEVIPPKRVSSHVLLVWQILVGFLVGEG